MTTDGPPRDGLPTILRGHDPRRVAAVVAAVLLVIGTAVYVASVAARAVLAPGSPIQAGKVLYIDLHDGLNAVVQASPDDPGGEHVGTGLRCLRVYSAAGTTVGARPRSRDSAEDSVRGK